MSKRRIARGRNSDGLVKKGRGNKGKKKTECRNINMRMIIIRKKIIIKIIIIIIRLTRK